MRIKAGFALPLLLLSFALCGAAHAADVPPTAEELEASCAAHPVRCDALKQKAATAKAKCDADSSCSQRAAEAVNKAKAAKAECAAKPALCEQKKAEVKSEADAAKAKCAADPTACEQKKKELLSKFRERKAARESEKTDSAN
jgi:hypothetical protein